MRRRGRLLAVLAVGVMLAAAACSGSGESDAPASATSTAAAIVVPSLAAEATPSATPTPTATATPAPTVTPRPTATAAPTPTLVPTATATPAPTATPVPVFLPGLYYRAPNFANPGGSLSIVGGGLPPMAMNPGGFSIRADRLVYPGGSDGLIIAAPTGASRTVRVPGLYQVARPSLSPDGRSAAVQASEDPNTPPGSLNIYVVDLANGTWRRISDRPVNEESPEWFPKSNRIAYSSFLPQSGVNLHVYDLDAQRDVLTVPGGGGIHLAVSPDERTILEPGRMGLYDVATGNRLADLREEAIAGVRGAGFEMDTRYLGQANRGTFPLDGTFSPDGRTIVFDGAVRRGNEYGIVMGQMSLTGTGFRVLSDLVPVNPAFSNNNNYSQLNPVWLGSA